MSAMLVYQEVLVQKGAALELIRKNQGRAPQLMSKQGSHIEIAVCRQENCLERMFFFQMTNLWGKNTVEEYISTYFVWGKTLLVLFHKGV